MGNEIKKGKDKEAETEVYAAASMWPILGGGGVSGQCRDEHRDVGDAVFTASFPSLISLSFHSLLPFCVVLAVLLAERVRGKSVKYI